MIIFGVDLSFMALGLEQGSCQPYDNTLAHLSSADRHCERHRPHDCALML